MILDLRFARKKNYKCIIIVIHLFIYLIDEIYPKQTINGKYY